MVETKVVNRNLIIFPSNNRISSFHRDIRSFSITSLSNRGDFDKVILDELGEARFFHFNSILNVVKTFDCPVFHASPCSNYSEFSPSQDILPSFNSNDYIKWQYRRDLPKQNFFYPLVEIKKKVLFLNGKFRIGRYYFLKKVIKNINTSDWILNNNNFISSKFFERKIELQYKGVENYLKDKIQDKFIQNFTDLKDHLNFSYNPKTKYGNGEHEWPLPENYSNTFLELISETFSENGIGKSVLDTNAIFATEKIFKPLLAGRPFIINANPGFLENIHSLGFRTFSRWWDESYDSISDIDDRHDIILKNLNFINSCSNIDLLNLYNDMLPTLKHNAELANKFMKDKREVEKFVS